VDAGGSKTWLATDETFMQENFVADTAAYYGLYLTQKSGTTIEFLNEVTFVMGSGLNADQVATVWNSMMWSKQMAICQQWMRYLDTNRGLFFCSSGTDGQDGGELPVPANAPRQQSQQQRSQQQPHKLQQQLLRSFLPTTKSKGKPASNAQPKFKAQSSDLAAGDGSLSGLEAGGAAATALSGGSAAACEGGQTCEQEDLLGPFNEQGFPLKLVMPDREILSSRACPLTSRTGRVVYVPARMLVCATPCLVLYA